MKNTNKDTFRKYLSVSVSMTIILWIVNVLIYDIYNLPAWLCTPIIAVGWFIVRFRIERSWVFKGVDDDN